MTLKELEKYVNWYIKRYKLNETVMYYRDTTRKIEELIEKKTGIGRWYENNYLRLNEDHGNIIIEYKNDNGYYRSNFLMEIKVKRKKHNKYKNGYVWDTIEGYSLKEIEIINNIDGVETVEDLINYVENIRNEQKNKNLLCAKKFIRFLNDAGVTFEKFKEIQEKWRWLNGKQQDIVEKLLEGDEKNETRNIQRII